MTTYKIQLVHQNPHFKSLDKTRPLWWQGPLQYEVRSEEWKPSKETAVAFRTLDDALARVRQMAPMVYAVASPA